MPTTADVKDASGDNGEKKGDSVKEEAATEEKGEKGASSTVFTTLVVSASLHSIEIELYKRVGKGLMKG